MNSKTETQDKEENGMVPNGDFDLLTMCWGAGAKSVASFVGIIWLVVLGIASIFFLLPPLAWAYRAWRMWWIGE